MIAIWCKGQDTGYRGMEWSDSLTITSDARSAMRNGARHGRMHKYVATDVRGEI